MISNRVTLSLEAFANGSNLLLSELSAFIDEARRLGMDEDESFIALPDMNNKGSVFGMYFEIESEGD